MHRTTANVKPRVQTGMTGTTSGATPTTDYEKIRVHEISLRCKLYALKVERMQANLLDRATVQAEIATVLSSIREVIMQSRLSQSEKADVCANLLSAERFAENVSQRQTKGATREDESTAASQNGGIDVDGE